MSLTALNPVGPPQLVRQQAFETLSTAIISGQIRPGTRLIERELCQAMGISRASVREVIRRLEAERLVVVEPRRGPTVSKLTPKQAREIYEVRSMLEVFLVERFTRTATDDEVAGLRKVFGVMKEAARKRSLTRRISLMLAFTNHMMKVVDHEAVRDLLDHLNARISVLRVTATSKPGRLEASLIEMETILEAIEARDPGRAAKAMEAYVSNARDAALDRLAEEDDTAA